MKPEWCPQWAWDEAVKIERSLPSHAKGSIGDYTNLVVVQPLACALLEAHQRGRREGMEEIFPLLERLRHWIEDEVDAELPFTADEQEAFYAIRAKMEEQP